MISPPWGTVHYYYWRFRREGIWQQINDALREKVRLQEKRKATPSAAIIDSQSVKTAEKGGFEAMARERKSMVVSGIPANVQDRDGAKAVLKQLLGRFPRLRLIWADGGYLSQAA